MNYLDLPEDLTKLYSSSSLYVKVLRPHGKGGISVNSSHSDAHILYDPARGVTGGFLFCDKRVSREQPVTGILTELNARHALFYEGASTNTPFRVLDVYYDAERIEPGNLSLRKFNLFCPTFIAEEQKSQDIVERYNVRVFQ